MDAGEDKAVLGAYENEQLLSVATSCVYKVRRSPTW